MTSGPLRLGPLLRHIGETSASVWVETEDAATVVVRCNGREWSARTFRVNGHHYALVVIDGLRPGTVQPYAVEVAGEQVWPLRDSSFPEPRIATLDRGRPTRLAFGSCRTSVPHDAQHNEIHGVDALRAFAFALAGDEVDWPDLVCFLGDQVYADQTSEEMRDFIEARRDIDEPPWEELKDYEEYCHLYSVAWTEEANRWLLSTLPSTMIFDDHDIRDDWNTSWSWHEEINATSWWHERLVGGLASYWVYQHIGNLDPAELAQDPLWQRVMEHEASGAPDELDLSAPLEDLVARNDRHPEVYRWSYSRDLGDSRLIVIDSRAARVLEPERRAMLDPGELAWLDEQMRGDVDHLLIGTSLPFLLSPGLHDLETLSETAAEGRWGRLLAKGAEKARQDVDLEHWAAFTDGFSDVFDMAMSVARGERGRPPGTVTFLSGDVHHSYVTELVDAAAHGARSRIVQVVCSPIRNPMPRLVRVLMAVVAKGLALPMRLVATRSSHIENLKVPWRVTEGPWFDNTLAVLEVRGRGWTVRWRRGEVVGDDHDRPRLADVARVDREAPPEVNHVTSGSVQG